MADQEVQVIQADYHNAQHAHDIITLLDAYAMDPMGGGEPLGGTTKENLIEALAKRSNAFSMIAYVEDTPVGLANCFEGFSTFACKPLINIHDIVVLEAYRGKGINQKLMAGIEAIAKNRGCCKLTLEVLSGNEPAKSAYTKFGFSDYQLDPEAGVALFWQKKLS